MHNYAIHHYLLSTYIILCDKVFVTFECCHRKNGLYYTCAQTVIHNLVQLKLVFVGYLPRNVSVHICN